jgi:hypothetical protein
LTYYYCPICNDYLQNVDGVIVHLDIPHPFEEVFEEEDMFGMDEEVE